MKKIIEVQSNNVQDIEVLYNEYYNLKHDLEDEKKYQTLSIKAKIEIEVV